MGRVPDLTPSKQVAELEAALDRQQKEAEEERGFMKVLERDKVLLERELSDQKEFIAALEKEKTKLQRLVRGAASSAQGGEDSELRLRFAA